MSDTTTPPGDPASPRLAWEEVSDGEAYAVWMDGSFAAVGRQLDGQWVPFVISRGEQLLRTGEPCASRHRAQRWAEIALA